MPPPEIAALAKDIILAVAGAITATVAVIGLTSWNRELRGKASFEAARALAKAMYRVRNELRSFRSPMIWASEFPADYKTTPGRKDPEAEARAYEHVYQNRWEPLKQALGDFDTATLEAEALWGKEVRDRTDELLRVVRKVTTAVSALVADARNEGEDFRADRDFGRQIRSTLSSSGDDSKNETSNEIASAVAGVEAVLRAHLRRG